MDHNPDRLCVWPGYFDMKRSRRSGRRVPKDASVLKPDLEGLFMAASAVGATEMSGGQLACLHAVTRGEVAAYRT